MTYLGLLVYFYLEYVRPASYWPQLLVLHLNSLVPLATLAASLVTTEYETKVSVFAARSTTMVFGFVFLVWLSVLTADVQMLSWNIFLLVAGFGGIYWLVACEVTTINRLKGVFMTLIAVHVVVAGLNPVLFTDPNNRHYIASGSFLGDGNDFALSVAITVPLCLFLLFDSKFWLKPAWIGCLLLLVAGVILTQSRGGTLSLIATGGYFWIRSRRKVLVGAIGAVLVLLVMTLAPPAYFERMDMIADTEEGSASARIMAWKVAVRMALYNPILGVGAGHFPVKIANEFRTPDVIGAGMNAHSVYFQVMGELGLPGISVLLFFVLYNLSANRKVALQVKERGGPHAERHLQLLASLSAALIAFATAGAFLSAAYYPHWFVLAGMMSASRRVIGQLEVAASPVSVTSSQREVWQHPALGLTPSRHRMGGSMMGERS